MADVYKVGVSLVMSGNFAQVLGALSQNLLGISKQVDQLQGKFSGLKLAIIGALGAYAGTKILETMGSMVKYGDQLVHQQNLMLAAGMSQKEVAEATARAYEVSARVQTTNLAEAARHIRELRYAFGGTEQATAEVGYVERANAVMKAVGGHDYSDQVWDIVKSLEMTNKTLDPKEFESYVDTMTRLYTASGGKITPQQIFQSFKYGRSAALGWDQEFIGGALGRAIQSMGGSTGGGGGRAGPGNALMSAYQAIVGDRMTKSAAHEFARLHLQTGQGIAGDTLFMRNPYEWVQQVLMPGLKGQGITSPEAVRKEIEKLFQNRTASQIISEFATQGRFMGGAESMYEKDIRLQGGAKGVSFFDTLMGQDYQTNMAAFTEQWTSLMQSLGSAMVPTAISVLKTFTDTFTSLTGWAKDNGDIVAELGKGLGILGAALLGGGAVAILAALGPAGWLAAGIIALGAAMVTWGPKIDEWFKSFVDKVRNFLGIGRNPIVGPTNTGDYTEHLTLEKIHNALIDNQLAAINRNTEQLKELNDQLRKSPIGGIGYYGPGIGGGGLINAAYTTYGGSTPFRSGGGYNYDDSGVASAPSFGGVASAPSFGGDVASAPGGGASGGLPHFSLGNIHSAITGRVASNPALGRIPNAGVAPLGGPLANDASSAVGASAWISAQRSGFAKELSDPNKRMQFAAMLLSEGTPLQTAESAMNRSDYAHKSLMQMLHSGFYGPINRGQLPSFMARLRRDPKAMAQMNAAIDAALGGSNTIHGATDQGMPSDPNGRWHGFPGHEFYIRGKGNIFNDWGGGPGGHAGSMRWREGFEAGANSHANLQHFSTDDIAKRLNLPKIMPHSLGEQEFKRGSDPVTPIPHHDDPEIHVHHNTHLDGRIIAKNTMKHMVKMGNGRVSGARLADYSGTRPAEV